MAGKKSILRISVQNTSSEKYNQESSSIKRKLFQYQCHIGWLLILKKFCSQFPEWYFKKSIRKSSEVCKKQNEKRELSNFREGSGDNYKAFSQLLTHIFSNNTFVYSNIFQRQLSISIILLLVLEFMTSDLILHYSFTLESRQPLQQSYF